MEGQGLIVCVPQHLKPVIIEGSCEVVGVEASYAMSAVFEVSARVRDAGAFSFGNLCLAQVMESHYEAGATTGVVACLLVGFEAL